VFVTGTVTAKLYGAGLRNDSGVAGVERSGSQTVHVFNADWTTYLDVVTKVAGGRVYDLGTGLTVLVGPVITDGTVWKSLLDGTTY
jgi:hypothetical protein